MGLKGKLSCQTEIKCHGNIFHDLFRHKPHHVSKYAHEKVQSCELKEGEYGKLGSVLLWKYKHEEKEKSMKTEIVDVDEEKKLITFKAIEGDVFDHYKQFSFTMHTESHHEHSDHHHGEKEEHKSFTLHTEKHSDHHHHGEKEEEEEEHKHLINWTFEYEKKYEEAPAPTSYLDWALSVTKDVEVHHVKK